MDRHRLFDANPDTDLDRHPDGNSDRDRHKNDADPQDWNLAFIKSRVADPDRIRNLDPDPGGQK